eukprot:COSAG02_NODE_2679_length_8261_cov_3.398922_3_plen_57_part_00
MNGGVPVNDNMKAQVRAGLLLLLLLTQLVPSPMHQRRSVSPCVLFITCRPCRSSAA